MRRIGLNFAMDDYLISRIKIKKPEFKTPPEKKIEIVFKDVFYEGYM